MNIIQVSDRCGQCAGKSAVLSAARCGFKSVQLRFCERHIHLEGISQKVLTESLRSMESDGIIVRTVYAEVPPRVEYSLSELGETLRPILDAMQAWGSDYKNNTLL